jgi:hypothetical protein
MNNKIILTFLLFLSLTNLYAQKITGLWKVDRVIVGDQVMTPVAKWFKFEKRGQYTAGNGWQQNDYGSYSYNKKEKTFLPKSAIQANEFGAFKIGIKGSEMQWSRMEQGMQVVVNLTPTTQITMAPKDSLLGIWEIEKYTRIPDKNEGDSIQHKKIEKLVFSWTQNYVQFLASGEKKRGYWYVHAHRPELRFIDFNTEAGVQKYAISFMADKLMLTNEEQGYAAIYSRSL